MSVLTSIGPEITFDFEEYLRQELGLFLPRLEGSGVEGVCKFFRQGFCAKGQNCQFKHTMTSSRQEKTVVCKHWLRGLCKKGDLCEFLHEYNLKKMPECWFFAKYGECSNPECLYLHIDPDSKAKECVWYARGFCKHGPKCNHKHNKKAACQLYLNGFCPKGPDCPFGHPKWEYSVNTNEAFAPNQDVNQSAPRVFHRSLDDITCFKCGERGHFANNCNQRGKQSFNQIPSYSDRME